MAQLQLQNTGNVNREVVLSMLDGVEEILDSLDMMTNPKLAETINKRIDDIKKGRVKTKTMDDFRQFLRKHNVKV